jgi:hypothetical protein
MLCWPLKPNSHLSANIEHRKVVVVVVVVPVIVVVEGASDVTTGWGFGRIQP